jgi:MFS family permease
MYALDWIRQRRGGTARQRAVPAALTPFGCQGEGQTPSKPVSPTVWYLGFTSLFTDVSSEMVSSILPLYFLAQLGLTPVQFGFVDGLYQGVTPLSRIASGFLADRWRRYKEIALIGYALSALCKPLFLFVGHTWELVAMLIAVDRTGKGIRTAPRDALISLYSEKENLGASFGVHRALDAVGAVIGPGAAFLILTHAPGAYDAVFVISFCLAILGLGVLALFVNNRESADPTFPAVAVSLKAATHLLKDKRFLFLVMIGGFLSVVTMSDSFIYLGIQQRLNISARFFPLFYLGTSLFYVFFSIPLGRLADRTSRFAVFIGGHVLLLGVYTAPLLLHIQWPIIFYLALFGAYYAATDGVLMAQAAEVMPGSLCASGLALLSTVTNTARLLSSVAAGWLWSRGSAATSTIFMAGLALAILVALGWRKVNTSHA